MKRWVLVTILFFSAVGCRSQVKADVDRRTNNFFLTGNIRNDYTIFGYSSANIHSKKMILFSVFTTEVKDNPHKCPLGSYYETSGLKEGDKITFVSIIGNFVKLNFITSNNRITPFYMKRKFIDFE